MACPHFAKNVLSKQLFHLFRGAKHKDTSDNTEFHSFRQWDSNHWFKIRLSAFSAFQHFQVPGAPDTSSDLTDLLPEGVVLHPPPLTHGNLHPLLWSGDHGYIPVSPGGGAGKKVSLEPRYAQISNSRRQRENTLFVHDCLLLSQVKQRKPTPFLA